MGDEGLIEVRNRQRTRRVSLQALRELVIVTLRALGCDGEIGLHLVGPAEMARLNWQFLRHTGSTDVITFDHGSTPERLHGECYLSVADAVRQAAEWDTTWEEELGRYVIHGLLHLRGYDDRDPAARRTMKRRENELVRRLVKPQQLLRQPAAEAR